MLGQCCGGGVRFRLFPKPPYVHPEWPPETISVSEPPGAIGPGPEDERMRLISRFTPHAWALDAYKQLLTNPYPELDIVQTACGVLAAFGAGFLALAWWCLKLDGEG